MKSQTTIANQSLIKKENLNPGQYTISLLQEGFRAGLIDTATIHRIQGKIMLIVKDLISRYTGGESSSVKLETAETILNSIYYAIDACVRSYPNPEDGIGLLKTGDLREIYQQGLERVAACVAETKQLYKTVLGGKLAVGTEAYHNSIEKDLPEFFESYGVVFGAHDTTCSMDYPLVFDEQGVGGIYYIKQYLEKLELETEFCRFFRQADLEKILGNFSRIYRMSYRKSLLNIFEVVFNNAVFAVLAGAPAGELRIAEADSKRIQKWFRNVNREELETLVGEALARLIGDLGVTRPELQDYMERYRAVFLERISNAVENDSLYNLILSDPLEKRAEAGILFEVGPKMKDEDFRRVIQEVRESSNPLDKALIIRSRIRSVEDLVDLLRADCLMGEEYGAVFGGFSEMELAVLGRMVFAEELRNGPLNLEKRWIGRRETEWEEQYLRFLGGLSKEKITSIEEFVSRMEGDFKEGSQ